MTNSLVKQAVATTIVASFRQLTPAVLAEPSALVAMTFDLTDAEAKAHASAAAALPSRSANDAKVGLRRATLIPVLPGVASMGVAN